MHQNHSESSRRWKALFLNNYYSLKFCDEDHNADEYKVFTEPACPIAHSNDTFVSTSGVTIRHEASSTASYFRWFDGNSSLGRHATMCRQRTTSLSGIVVGSGTIAPSPEDYKMDSLISPDDITITPNIVFPFRDGKHIGICGKYTMTNNTETDIVVSEIGLYTRPTGYKTTGSDTTTRYIWDCLVERTLLDEPITVSAGGTAQIYYVVYP